MVACCAWACSGQGRDRGYMECLDVVRGQSRAESQASSRVGRVIDEIYVAEDV